MIIKRRKLLYTFLLSYISYVIAFAAEINFTASVDQTQIGLDDQIQLTVSVQGQDIGRVPNPELPDLPDFDRLGSTSSQSTSISIINGRMSQQQTISFIYFLRPKRTGTLTIGPCKLNFKGQTYTTEPITIQVEKGSVQKPQAQPRISPFEPPTREAVPIEGNLMLVASPNKRTVYKGEQVTVDFTLYTRLQLGNLSLDKLPSFSGFWVEKLYDAQQLNFQERVINGKRYSACLLKKVALFPMQTGELTIEPMSLVGTVIRPARSFFDFFDETEPVKIQSQSIKINVLPLPETGKPADFSGGVGQFNIKASLKPDSSVNGEPVNLTIRISGTGNVKLIDKPSLPTIAGLKVLDPEVTDKVSTEGGKISGYKEFKYPILPQRDGRHEIPSIKLSYFDPSDKSYHTIETEKIVFIATGTAKIVSSTLTETGIKVLGTDIRHIKPNLTSLNSQSGIVPIWLTLLYPFSIAILIASVIYQRHRQRLEKDIGYARRLRSGRMMKKRFAEATKFLAQKNEKDFYSALARAVFGYVGDRFNIQAMGMTKEQLKEELIQKGVNQELLNRLLRIIDTCDTARFSPALVAGINLQQLLQETKEVLNKL
ncbi:MAG: BatD family protein [candidate division WOR-3 bacterium]